MGNRFRGDDAVGLVVAERLKARRPELAVVAHTGDMPGLCAFWGEVETAIVIDAVSSGEIAGTIARYEVGETPLPAAAFRGSTHAFGVADAIELGRAVGALPPRLVVYGVVGACFDTGCDMSPAVARAADELTERLLAEVTAADALAPRDHRHA